MVVFLLENGHQHFPISAAKVIIDDTKYGSFICLCSRNKYCRFTVLEELYTVVLFLILPGMQRKFERKVNIL